MQVQTLSPTSPAIPRAPAVPVRLRDRGVFTLTYSPGEPIYVEGDAPHSLYRIVCGAVRTVRHSVDGRRQIGGFYYPGDLFGLDGEEGHAYSAEAMCATEVVVYRQKAPAEERSDRTDYCAAIAELSRTQHHLSLLGRRSASDKVASFLVDMARRDGSDVASLPMSRQDMADYLGLAIETVSRVLGQFQIQGLVVFVSCRDFQIVRGAALNRLAAS